MLRHLLTRTAVLLAAPAFVLTAAVTPAQASLVLTTISLDTDASVDSNYVLTVTATGTFDGSLIANSTVALQIVGAETYVDGSGQQQTIPLAGVPSAVSFSHTNTVQWQWQLHSTNSTVNANWTAEVVGLAPTPFSGSCAGTYTLLNATEAKVKSC
jgi:hypothetical protein